jgi:hypothetical protein
MIRKFGLVLGAIALAALVGSSGAKNKAANANKADTKGLASKSTKVTLATTIDFSDAFGLSFDSLGTLGTRIEAVRKSPDPVALALLATELAIAEKVSDKTATLTAETLLKEAVDMAKQRHASKELTAVAMLVKDTATKEKLVKLSKLAATYEKEATEAFKNKEKPKGVWGYLTVRNNTGNQISIYVNGRYYGYVNAYRDYRFGPLRHNASTNTVLVGKSGGLQWGPLYKDNPVGDEIWTLD